MSLRGCEGRTHPHTGSCKYLAGALARLGLLVIAP
jgi:hypothetical protein